MVEDMEKKIEGIVNKKLNLDEPDEADYSVVTDEYPPIASEANDLIEHCDRITHLRHPHHKEAINIISADTQRNELKEAIKAIYHLGHSTTPKNVANTLIGHDRLIDLLKKQIGKVIFIIGKRGVGKSIYLNYLINTEFKELAKQNKMVWYRADISHLHTINIQHLQDLRILPDDDITRKGLKRPLEYCYTLTDYLNVLLLYITFKYRHGNKAFQEIHNNAGAHITQLIKTRYDNTTSSNRKKLNSPLDILSINKNLIEKRVKSYRKIGDFYSFIKKDIKDMLLDNKRKYEYKFLAGVILDYLREKDYKIVYIIDGVDNLEYHDNVILYENLILQLSGFINKCYKNLATDNILMALRTETYQHLKDLNIDLNDKTTRRFYIKAPDPKELLVNRSKSIFKPIHIYNKSNNDTVISIFKQAKFANEKEDKVQGLINDNNKEFLSTFAEISDELKKALIRLLPSKALIKETTLQDKFFEVVYNDNMRDLLHNSYNIFLYKMVHKTKRDTSGKPYITYEGQLLNGKLFLDSKNEKLGLGVVIPNLFYYNKHWESKIWHGLCSIRILQYLLKRRSSKENVIDDLEICFNYRRDIIKERFYEALAYGLIDCKYNARSRRRLYSISKKGKFIIFYPFYNIDIFYHFAIDSPLPYSLVENGILIRCHSHENKYWEYYIESCIITSITFIRYIKLKHKEEMKSVNKTCQEYSVMFRLPEYFPGILKKDIIKQYNVLKNISPIRAKDLRLDIDGMV